MQSHIIYNQNLDNVNKVQWKGNHTNKKKQINY